MFCLYCKQLFDFSAHFAACRLDREKDGEPYGEVDGKEYRGENKYHDRLERYPGINEIREDVDEVKRAEVTAEALCYGPGLYLVKDAYARLNECDKVGRYDREQYLPAREIDGRAAFLYYEKDQPQDNRAEAAENKSAVKKAF